MTVLERTSIRVVIEAAAPRIVRGSDILGVLERKRRDGGFGGFEVVMVVAP